MSRLLTTLVLLLAVALWPAATSWAQAAPSAGEPVLLAKGGGSGSVRSGSDGGGHGSGHGRGGGSDELFDDSGHGRHGRHGDRHIFFDDHGRHHHGDDHFEHRHGEGLFEHKHRHGEFEIKIEDHGRGGHR